MIVLDSSAIIAVILEEPGAEFVLAHGPGGVVSSVNYSEVLSRMNDLGARPERPQRAMQRLGLTVVPFDQRLADRAGELRPATRHLGLSLGDRACLALAQQLSATVLTGDRDWAKLDLGVEVQLIR